MGLPVAVPHMAENSATAVREASLKVKGARLFNLVSKEVRNLSGVSMDTFKSVLDVWLSGIPDQPTIPGRQRSALINSLLDQVGTTFNQSDDYILRLRNG